MNHRRNGADTLVSVEWEIDAYRRSVAGLSPDTVRAYASDVERFAEWAQRGRKSRSRGLTVAYTAAYKDTCRLGSGHRCSGGFPAGRQWAGRPLFCRMRCHIAGKACAPVEVLNATSVNVPARVRELTNGHGADIVYNTVGDPYYEQGTKSLAFSGRQIFISAKAQTPPFDIFAFYRGRHTYVGVDSLALTSCDMGDALRRLLPGFVSGHLSPFPIAPHAIFPLERAREAYIAVWSSARNRMVFKP